MPAMDGMDPLLTARQMQDLLQVDRITIYRMLADGRLQGFKVGGQWRFSRRAVERWLQEQKVSLPATESPRSTGEMGPSPSNLPIDCIQAIQGIFAEAMDIGTITTGLDGNPLTDISNSCEFCNLLLRTEAGRQRCSKTWQAAAIGSKEPAPQIAMCHAGLHYVSGGIKVHGEFVAATHAGQFLFQPPGDDEWSQRIAELSAAAGVEAGSLRRALSSVPVLERDKQEQVRRLLQRMVETFSEIGEERLSLLGRLQRIAEMTEY